MKRPDPKTIQGLEQMRDGIDAAIDGCQGPFTEENPYNPLALLELFDGWIALAFRIRNWEGGKNSKDIAGGPDHAKKAIERVRGARMVLEKLRSK